MTKRSQWMEGFLAAEAEKKFLEKHHHNLKNFDLIETMWDFYNSLEHSIPTFYEDYLRGVRDYCLNLEERHESNS